MSEHSLWGSIFAFVVTLAVIGLGGYLIYIGRGVSGLVAIIGALVGLVALFAVKRSSQNKELREKRAGLPVKQ